MSETTSISWTQRTWNPWEGCSRISPGCRNCYMFAQLQRRGRDPSTLRRTGTWGDPDRWNAIAARTGEPVLVFACSLTDWFHEGADEWRPEAWQVVRRCQHLRFQILTKRPFRIAEHLPPDWGEGYENVWLGASIEDDEHVWRADVLRKIPARIRFVSAEPLLGPLPSLDLRGFHWLIVGGESGPGYRGMDRDWARQLRDMAKAQGVAFFFKQSSAFRPGQGDLLDGRHWHEFPSTPAIEAAQPEVPPSSVQGEEPEAARRQHGEVEHLQAELRRHRQEVQSLQADLEQQRHETERVRADLELSRDEAARMEVRWVIRLDEALLRAHAAEQRLKNLRELMLRTGGFPVSVHLDLMLLGLKWPCTLEEIKTAYRKLAFEHHPDRSGDEEKFKKVQAAYDRLCEFFACSG